MELCIENFTAAGNNLMYRKEWERYQHEHCESKTRVKMMNKLHYNRILDGLTDNRSIDILNDASLKNVKKMDTREYIKKYIQENNGKMSVEQMANGVAIALDVPVSDVVEYRKIYDAVIEEMKMIHELTNTLLRTPARIDISRGGKDMETQTSAEGVDAETNTIYISIDGKDVGIQATVEGVVAETNTFSIQGVSSQRRDNETGELAVVHWDGDNQAPSRGVNTGGFNVNNFANSGDQMSQDPGQFSLPTNMPPPMTPVVFNRNALPDTTELPYKVDASLMISDKPVSNTVAIQTQDGLVDIIPRAAQFSDLVSMVEGMNIKTKKQTTQTQDRLQELFKPRTTYIRTHATELPQEPKGTGLTLQELASSAGTQTHGRYFNPTVEMTPGNVRKFASGREGAKETKKDNETNRITQTAQTGETGFMTTQKQLSAHPVGGYAGTQRVYGPRTTSGAQIMSPLRPFFAP